MLRSAARKINIFFTFFTATFPPPRILKEIKNKIFLGAEQMRSLHFLIKLFRKKVFRCQLTEQLYYLNSIFLALNPCLCTCIFLHTLHSNLKSVFLVDFLPVILNLLIAGFEYLPKLPFPLACPLFLALIFEP